MDTADGDKYPNSETQAETMQMRTIFRLHNKMKLSAKDIATTLGVGEKYVLQVLEEATKK